MTIRTMAQVARFRKRKMENMSKREKMEKWKMKTNTWKTGNIDSENVGNKSTICFEIDSWNSIFVGAGAKTQKEKK